MATPGPFTVSASVKDFPYTTSLTADVSQYPGILTLSDNPVVNGSIPRFLASGTTYQVTATSAGDHLLQWIVDWGDGESQIIDVTSTTPNQISYQQVLSHDYSVQGPFTVTVTAVYPDRILDRQESFWSYSATSTLWSFAGNGAFGVEQGSPAIAGVTDAKLNLYNLHIGMDTYTINWGDGTTDDPDTTTVTADDGSSFLTPAHDYMHDGTYNVTVVNSEGGSSGWYEQVGANSGPTITPPAEQIVAAGDAVNITATYSGMTPGASPVAYITWAGITELMTVTPDDTGTSGTLTASFAHAAITSPTATIRLFDANLADSDYVSEPSATFADFNIDVWGVVIGDGTDNDLLMASADGTQNLQPVTVYFPHPAGEALNLTLTTTDATDDVLWDTSSPNASVNTPVLGGGVSSYSFSVGPDGSSHTFYVGATAGSTIYDVLAFSISGAADEDNSTSDFRDKETAGDFASTGVDDPVSPDGNSGSGGNKMGDCENAASAGDFTLKLMDNPNTDTHASVVKNQTEDWLVGQQVFVYGALIAPKPNIAGLKFRWAIPGDVLRLYSWDPGQKSIVTPLGDAVGNATTGLNQRGCIFYWMSTGLSDVPESYDVKLYITDAAGVEAAPLVTTFVVHEPDSSASVENGTAGLSKDNTTIGIVDSQEVFSASVDLPEGFTAPGTWVFRQLENRNIFFTMNGVKMTLPKAGTFNLDTHEFYLPKFPDDQFPAKQFGWTTGSGTHKTFDNPGLVLAHFDGIDPQTGKPTFTPFTDASMNNEYETYLMFKPEGKLSVYVPLRMLTWQVGVSVAQDANKKMVLVKPPTQPSGAFALTTDIPRWNLVNTSKDSPVNANG